MGVLLQARGVTPELLESFLFLVVDVDGLEERRRAHRTDGRVVLFHVNGPLARRAERRESHARKVACFVHSHQRHGGFSF